MIEKLKPIYLSAPSPGINCHTAYKTYGSNEELALKINEIIDHINSGQSIVYPVGLIQEIRKVDPIPENWQLCDGTNGTPDFSPPRCQL